MLLLKIDVLSNAFIVPEVPNLKAQCLLKKVYDSLIVIEIAEFWDVMNLCLHQALWNRSLLEAPCAQAVVVGVTKGHWLPLSPIHSHLGLIQV